MVARYELEGTANEIAALAFKVWRQRFYAVWQYLKDRDLLQDWRHTAYMIALEASKAGFKPGQRKLLGFIYNRWYAFLKAYGFFKKDGSSVQPRYEFLEDVVDRGRAKKEERQSKPTKTRITTLVYKYQGQKIIFTQHFMKRWKERIPLEFSPLAVYQQILLGQPFKMRWYKECFKANVKCPWFTVALAHYKDRVVLITVWT